MGVPPPDDPKHKIVMGYPSMDRYHLQATPAPYPPPTVYGSSSIHHHQLYPSTSSQPPPPPFQHDGQYPNAAPPLGGNQYNQPYNEYYYQQHYKPLVPLNNNNDSDSSSFGRVMLILMIVLVASMCMMSLVMWFLFGTYIPEFEVASLKVSNFTATDTTLTGTWEVELSVTNTNKELAVNFDRVMSSIFYKEALLGISTLQPFQVDQMNRSTVNFSMPAEQKPNDMKLQSWVLPTLSQDQSNGVVVFSLRLAMKTNFTTANLVYRQENLRVLCENVQVVFTVGGKGTMSPGLGNICLIRLHDGDELYFFLWQD
ncbi:hypothetical protein ABFX02_10G063900 [Erythranthe guttata]